jgi:tRNA (guanine37-N1)-methyltransferase
MTAKMMALMKHKISFSYITLFPELIRHYLSDALLNKAQINDVLKFNIFNLRDYSQTKYKSVDDTAYGGGDGMVFELEPLIHCLTEAKAQVSDSKKTQVIYLSPQGQPFSHQKVLELAKYDHLIFVCGRYAGIDQRFIANYVDQEISVGDYVLSGGELPSLVLTEAISRHIEGVLGDKVSAEKDSFSNQLDGLLEAPQFTKPQNLNDMTVPEVLFSGNHQKISEWQKHISVLTTLSKRSDLLNDKIINWLQVSEFYKSVSDLDRKTLQIEALEEKLNNKLSVCMYKGSL